MTEEEMQMLAEATEDDFRNAVNEFLEDTRQVDSEFDGIVRDLASISIVAAKFDLELHMKLEGLRSHLVQVGDYVKAKYGKE